MLLLRLSRRNLRMSCAQLAY
ncbi:hypothetical protein Taro_046825 [Colocasia esculenta]|uniref:Uncharacterized protein n=1 Tax=Colocasia esculenta TaxID=4460 RepID=A0A843WZN0_COLES|nr:hypothetical protein [Colocasia esculenta]